MVPAVAFKGRRSINHNCIRNTKYLMSRVVENPFEILQLDGKFHQCFSWVVWFVHNNMPLTLASHIWRVCCLLPRIICVRGHIVSRPWSYRFASLVISFFVLGLYPHCLTLCKHGYSSVCVWSLASKTIRHACMHALFSMHALVYVHSTPTAHNEKVFQECMYQKVCKIYNIWIKLHASLY
jgi:hypothetical protein